MSALTEKSRDLDQLYHIPKNIFPKKPTEIQKFYAKKNVLITGATGFLGKLLVEKLLWSCPDIGNVYLMLRQKKGKDSSSRIDDLLASQAFTRLKRDQPMFKDKIKMISGDCELPNLGISDIDREEIIENVNIIFHVAASVRFHEPLTHALTINLKATQTLIEIGKEMKNLNVFIHVSTAYSQCHSQILDERFYDSPMDPIKLLKFLETSDQKIIDEISPKLLGKWPNTYTFSKALTEDYIRQSAVGMPVGIFRPSIIISSVNEPVPRWVDNWYGVNGYVTACGAGVLRVMKGSYEMEANLVPVDMCVNGMIAAAWDVYERSKIQSIEKPHSRDIRIYNYVSTDNPITWGKFYQLACRGGEDHPPIKALWYRTLYMSTSSMKHQFYKIFLHYVPAIILDSFYVCIGKKAEVFKMYDRIHKMDQVTQFFSTKCWNFSSHNVAKLVEKMSEEDRQLYACDIRKMNWDDYLKGYFLGVRRYLMKDDDSTLEAAKRKYTVLYWMHKFIKLIFFICMISGMFKSGRMIFSRLNAQSVLK